MNKMTSKKAAIIAATLATSFILVACDNDSQDDAMVTPMQSSNQMSTSTKGIENKEFDVSMEQAVEIFKETYPDAQIVSINLDKNFANYVYEIEGFNELQEIELSIDTMSGEISKQKTENKDDLIDDDSLVLEGLITPQEAMKVALEKVGKGYAKDWALDSENGTVYYEIDLQGSGQGNDDALIDAKTGEFIGLD
ncbi:PepSY domain-containing protein [Carnobacterium sp. TMP28]|uniref:PepSY domain-containing protein n=1 Tax=Carnobacterium sp. TMP28 TaxID=3397060 RepID=UPI0039E0E164